MRPIKFRAWIVSESRMIDVHQIDLKNFEIQELARPVRGHKWIWHEDDFNLMQFTGLLDKNGKEIYEGDLVKEYWKPCGDDAVVCGEYIGEVFYEDAGYWTRSKNHHHAITETCDSYEVIGNIFEHGNLIEEK